MDVTAPTAVTAVLPTAVGVAVNLATGWMTNPWAWVAIGFVALLSIPTDASVGVGGVEIHRGVGVKLAAVHIDIFKRKT